MREINKTPSHSCPSYVIARVKKILAAKGWPLQKKTGRYSAFNSTVVATEGFSVHKVGVGKMVAVGYSPAHSHGREHALARGVARSRVAEAVEHLRALGYRIDGRGWIECEGHDIRDV
jgi:hypothetical protein